MVQIVAKQNLHSTVTRMVISAPAIAAKAQPGQFVILRVDEKGERIPLTISDYDSVQGTITLVFQIVGATTEKLNRLQVGDYIQDVAGPLGNPTHTQGFSKVAVVGGGVGCAIAYPVAKKLFQQGCQVDVIAGFKTADLVILQEELQAVSHTFVLMTDDGSAGEKGLVTHGLERLIEQGAQYDCVMVIGPLVMMKFVSQLTKQYQIKTIVSMNPIMIDGTGMCGGCRLTVGGQVKFACVDGPEFDGHLVDFDQAIARSDMYRQIERARHEETCNLFKEVNVHG